MKDKSEQKCSLWLQSEGSEMNLIDCVWLDTRFYLTSVRPSVSLDVCVHVLQVALCFSPVGSKLRVRSRKFPAVVNCTAINWFHEWPQEALESVSFRFLEDVENINVRTVHNRIQWGEATHLNDFHTLMIWFQMSTTMTERMWYSFKSTRGPWKLNSKPEPQEILLYI